MKLYTNTDLSDYLKTDTIGKMLSENQKENELVCTSHQWLLDSPPKRMLFSNVYKDILTPGASRLTVLDVGGGYCSITKLFLKNHNYFLLDIMAHDKHDDILALQQALMTKFWLNSDWLAYPVKENYDLIISNDLFPNVDQRLEMFIEKYLPFTRKIRLLLTFYKTPRFYKVKRTDGDEIFYMLAWNQENLKIALHKFKDRIIGYDPLLLDANPESMFPNKRQIVLIDIKGDV